MRIKRSEWLADPIGTTQGHSTVHIVDDDTGDVRMTMCSPVLDPEPVKLCWSPTKPTEAGMGERDLVVKYMRDLAERRRQDSHNGRNAIARQLAAMQAKTLYDVANEIKQGAHMPKGQE